VEHLVQTARITDIDRLAALTGQRRRARDKGLTDVADLLRTIVHEDGSAERPGGADPPERGIFEGTSAY
jgi:hypothetical protein